MLKYYAPAVFFAILIFVVSSFPGQRLPSFHFSLSDKVAHFFEFGIFGVLLYRAFRDGAKVRYPFLLTVLTGMAYAAFDELHQAFVPGRFSDVTDFIADLTGLLFWVGIFVLITTLWNTQRIKTPSGDSSAR